MKLGEIREQLKQFDDEYDLRMGENTLFDFIVRDDDKIVVMIPMG